MSQFHTTVAAMRDTLVYAEKLVGDFHAEPVTVSHMMRVHAVNLGVDVAKARSIWDSEHRVASRKVEANIDNLLAKMDQQIKLLPTSVRDYPRDRDVTVSRVRLLLTWATMICDLGKWADLYPLGGRPFLLSVADERSIAAAMEGWKKVGYISAEEAHRVFRSGS